MTLWFISSIPFLEEADILSRLSKRIAILGSTGSIGCNALEVVEHLGSPYRVVAISAHRQTEKLLGQVERYRPAAVAIAEEQSASSLPDQLKKLGAKVYVGPSGLVEMIRRDDIDVILSAIV